VSNNEQQKPSWLTLGIVTIAVGVTSGLGGMALGLLLRVVQHIAFGYSLHKIVGGESFLQGVTAASDLRRFLALCGCRLYTRVANTTIRAVTSPLDRLAPLIEGRPRPKA
jgi:hypothetical protein